MSTPDIKSVSNVVTQLGLATTAQVKGVLEEMEPGQDNPLIFLRAMERKAFLTPWQSSKLIRGDEEGFYLGGYRILYKIASGSFGRVFRADNPRTGEVVAIKILRRRWSEDPHSIELFEREGKVGMTLRHPNIVSILAVNHDEDSGQFFIIMEFVEGQNLREFLTVRKKLEPHEALALLEDAATGLAYAFSRGVTHRDIKPSNLLISTQGAAKLVDFGLARIYAGKGQEEEDHIDRTVDYAGLERATDAPEGDIRSDIYFLGTVTYEMLTGRPPLLVTRDRYQRMLKERFMNVAPINPDEIAGPAIICHLVQTMMAFNPKDRFQTPAQLVEAVRKARVAVGAKGAATHLPARERSVFVVEKDEKLKDVMRDKLKKHGYRVFLAADPVVAQDRFRQRPFDALIVNVGTVGEEGLFAFQQILVDADRQKLGCIGVLLLAKEQADWAERVRNPRAAVLIQPVTFKQLTTALSELMPTH